MCRIINSIFFLRGSLWTLWRINGLITTVLLVLGLLAGRVTTAHAAGERWAQRPPTLDPTYGLPLPAHAVEPFGAVPFWIWAAKTLDYQIIYLRHVVNLKKVPHHVVLYASADNHLELFLNGKKITSTFNKHNQVWRRGRVLSVAAILHPGDNIIAIRAKNDQGEAGVVVWMVADGKTLCVTNGKWRVANAIPAGAAWTLQRFDDSTWSRATVEARYGTSVWGNNGVNPWPMQALYLAHLYFQPMRVTVLHGPRAFKGISSVAVSLSRKTMTESRPGYQGRSLLAPSHRIDLTVTSTGSKQEPELLLSFGQEVAGRIQVRGSGGTVLVGTGESRGEAVHSPWGKVHKLDLTDEMTQSTPYSAFRYVTVTFNGSGPIQLNRLRLDFKYYPVKYRGAFACSNPLLTKLWYTGAYTTHLCMQEQIWDAPKRDRMMWMGDLQISGEVINNIFLDRYLMELTIHNLGGNLPIGGYVNGIPGYSNAWICGLADLYKHTGEIGYVRSEHALLLSMLRFIKTGFNQKNIFVNTHKSWCFVDWAPQLKGSTPQALTTTDLYTCWAVRRAVFLLKALGDTANAAKYARWDKQLIDAARQYLANPQTHTYTNLRQVNAMAIDSHVADAQQRAAIDARILGPKCPSWKQMASPYYNNFVLFAVGHLGHTNEALAFVQKYWGGMVSEGATTFWEAYDPSWPKKHFHRYLKADNGQGYFVSLCHGWSAGVTNWLTEYVLGIQAQSGGFARVSIVPHLGDLKWASGCVPTTRGNIVLRAAKTGVVESMALTLPPDFHAVVGVRGHSVTVNGEATSPVRHSDKRCYIHLAKEGTYSIVGR